MPPRVGGGSSSLKGWMAFLIPCLSVFLCFSVSFSLLLSLSLSLSLSRSATYTHTHSLSLSPSLPLSGSRCLSVSLFLHLCCQTCAYFSALGRGVSGCRWPQQLWAHHRPLSRRWPQSEDDHGQFPVLLPRDSQKASGMGVRAAALRMAQPRLLRQRLLRLSPHDRGIGAWHVGAREPRRFRGM